ncbi:MAG: hypothetical protein AAF911_07320 [Planctomycetota bacterium]
MEKQPRNDEQKTHNTIKIPEGEYALTLAELAGRIASEKHQNHEKRWRGLLTIVIGILAFFGYSNITGIRQDLARQIEQSEDSINTQLTQYYAIITDAAEDFESKIEDSASIAVNKQFEDIKTRLTNDVIVELQGEVDAKLSFIDLQKLVQEIDESDSISSQDSETARKLLKLCSNTSVERLPSFSTTLESLVDNFHLASMETDIDSIDSIHRDLLLSESGTTWTMVTHYGIRCCSRIKTDMADIEKFQVYAKSARSKKLRGVSLPFELLIDYQNNDETNIDDWFIVIENLDPANQQLFFNFYEEYLSGSFAKRATPETVMLVKRFKQMHEVIGSRYEEAKQKYISDSDLFS